MSNQEYSHTARKNLERKSYSAIKSVLKQVRKEEAQERLMKERLLEFTAKKGIEVYSAALKFDENRRAAIHLAKAFSENVGTERVFHTGDIRNDLYYGWYGTPKISLVCFEDMPVQMGKCSLISLVCESTAIKEVVKEVSSILQVSLDKRVTLPRYDLKIYLELYERKK